MDGLSDAAIKMLFAPKPRKLRTSKRYMVTNTSEGLVREPFATSEIAHYEGKVGTVRRSRKGKTQRQANGRRFYVPNFDKEVVAYKA